jgi:hypothetical protein
VSGWGPAPGYNLGRDDGNFELPAPDHEADEPLVENRSHDELLEEI